MKPKFPIPRPTEHAAIGNASLTAQPLPPMPVLFAGLLTAQALDDRHGANLFAHAIARSGQGPHTTPTR
ncbi:hypothetical protein [Streptomyces sp. RPT161]|uniref:hypothetical protein n=1 Tax=Streptomyces sp. RPT161 TaxID=3015993 RepID=UPI0022B8859F|nr:hypothetical protein [Streptomyces sp. RPT161]